MDLDRSCRGAGCGAAEFLGEGPQCAGTHWELSPDMWHSGPGLAGVWAERSVAMEGQQREHGLPPAQRLAWGGRYVGRSSVTSMQTGPAWPPA